MRKSAKGSSGIKALKEDLRERGDLPPSQGELRKHLRKTGEVLPSGFGSSVPSKNELLFTPIEYGGLQTAFSHFNKTLFNGELPDAFIVYSRRAHSGGHYAPNRYSGRGSDLHRDELSLNPDGFVGQSDKFICAILVHEMDHHWQEKFGIAKKRKNYGYHDKEWAAKMESQGLMPSNTGMVGGKRTGQRMSHYIIPGDAYEQAFDALAATGWKLNLQSTITIGAEKKPPSKVKFTCPRCASNMWGKPDSLDICGECNLWRKPEIAEPVDAESFDLELSEATE